MRVPDFTDIALHLPPESELLRGSPPIINGSSAPPTARVLLPSSIDWPTFWARDRSAEDWLVGPFLPRGRMTALWANRKAGKSLLALEVAAALATGRPILDRPASAPIDVAYFDLEMTEEDLYERLEDMGYGPGIDLTHLHYYLLPTLPPLDTAEGGAAIDAIVVRDQARVAVFDTMARIVRGEEDSSTTYRAFYQHTGVRLKKRGITVLRLDHAGKDPTKDARGSSAKGDDIDLGWELKAGSNGSVTLNRRLTRMSWVPDRVVLHRHADPLRHELAPGLAHPPGTEETARELDRLSVPLDAASPAAGAALRQDGKGRRKEVVLAAMKLRRQADYTSLDSGTTPGTVDVEGLHLTAPEPEADQP